MAAQLPGSWQKGYDRLALGNHAAVGATMPLLTFLSRFGKCSKTNTQTQASACTHKHAIGLSPDLLNLAPNSGTCY